MPVQQHVFNGHDRPVDVSMLTSVGVGFNPHLMSSVPQLGLFICLGGQI